MEMKSCLRWLSATLPCCLLVFGNAKAESITYSPLILTPQLQTNGDVNLVKDTGPTVTARNDGFSLSRSYMMDATKTNGNGTATWRGDRNFDTDAKLNTIARIDGNTIVSFGTGKVLFTVDSFILDVNSGKLNDGPRFQQEINFGVTPVSWDVSKIIMGIEKSTAKFDDTLTIRSSVIWTDFAQGDRLIVDSMYAISLQVVPEPSALLLLSTGVVGVLAFGRRRENHVQ